MTGLAETAMVHADLHVGNVLVSDDGTITLKVSVRRNTALAAGGLRSPQMARRDRIESRCLIEPRGRRGSRKRRSKFAATTRTCRDLRPNR
jgi:hypothetical protein